jgi:hypothetical protein
MVVESERLFLNQTSSVENMFRPQLRSVSRGFLAITTLLVLGNGVVNGEMTESRRKLLVQSAAATREAGAAFQARELETASQKLQEAMQRVGEALEGADEDVYQASARLIDQIDRAHATLQLDGIVLPPFERPVFGKPWKVYAGIGDAAASNDATASRTMPTTPSRTTRPSRAKPPETKPEPPVPAMDGGISFVRQVAPVLMSRCGNCHVTGNRGQFSMPSYVQLMKGPAAGTVVFPGDPIGSRLIETIETGDMPRGGGKVPAAELQILKDWVTQGAKFDGPSPTAPLSSYATPTPMDANANNKPPMVSTATGKETVSFARQIAPLLVENCNGCHLDAMQIRGGLNMNTLAQLLRGGDSGEVIKPGDGDGSLLVRKLRGQEGARMPAGGRPALPEESIQLISTWINEGASLDAGSSADQNLRVMATETWAKNATHQELADRRKDMARDHWKIGIPVENRGLAVEIETEDVFVMGNVETEVAEMVGKAAGEAFDKVRTLIPLMGDQKDMGKSKFRGRVSVFLFSRRYDYSEFSKMVETRSIPSAWDVHWTFDGVDAYVSLVVSDEESPKMLAARLIAPLASLSVAQLGESPRWFREGVGRSVASKTAGREFEAPKAWDRALPEAVSVVKEPKELIEGRLPPEQADLVGYGIAKTLFDRQRRQQFGNLLKNIQSGGEFDKAFLAAFRIPLENYVTACFTN